MAHKDEKRNTLYANLMGEVKARIDCISTTCQGRGGYPSVIVREFCYLQLRILCELIALACLVAHGDISSLQTHKIGKAYSADEIIDRLSKLRPHFYPIPGKQIWSGPGKPVGFEALASSPFAKEELLALYGKTHRFVHRGTLKKLLSMDTPIDTHVNIPEIIQYAQKINDLLSHHVIAVSESHLIICLLRNADHQNNVQVITAERPQQKPLSAGSISGQSAE